jgi:hypothetical protein
MSTHKEMLQQCFHGNVLEKLKCAEEMYRRHGIFLLKDKELGADLEALKKLAQLVNTHMGAMRMGEQCVRCAQNERGGCCSLFMAGETDAIQLLMNMLIGVGVEQQLGDGVECCFLGGKGCLFLIKPFFCLNYICEKIHHTASTAEIKKLEILTGRLLNKQYEIEKKLLEVILLSKWPSEKDLG